MPIYLGFEVFNWYFDIKEIFEPESGIFSIFFFKDMLSL